MMGPGRRDGPQTGDGSGYSWVAGPGLVDSPQKGDGSGYGQLTAPGMGDGSRNDRVTGPRSADGGWVRDGEEATPTQTLLRRAVSWMCETHSNTNRMRLIWDVR